MNHILAIDGPNLAMRLYYRKGCKRPKDVVSHVRNALKGIIREWEPTHVIVALETDVPCFRYRLYPDYKGKRARRDGPSTTDVMRAIVEASFEEICYAWAPGYEADDVLATIAAKATRAGGRTSILSSDRDLWQLVNDGWVRCLYPENGKETIIRETDVKERLGVRPQQVPDLKVLAGDKSDNIPSIGETKQTKAGPRHYGFTEGRAASLLQQYNSIDEMIVAMVAHHEFCGLEEKEMDWLAASYGHIPAMRDVTTLVSDAQTITYNDLTLSDIRNFAR